MNVHFDYPIIFRFTLSTVGPLEIYNRYAVKEKNCIMTMYQSLKNCILFAYHHEEKKLGNIGIT